MILIFSVIGLVTLYDLKPFRLKDTPIEIFIVPFYTALPFLFSYLHATSNITLSPLIVFTFLFLFLNLITDVRHIPDFEHDLRLGASTFTVTFGVEATRKIELIASISTLGCLTAAVILGFLSIIGLPLLLITTYFKMSILLKQHEELRNPEIWKRFSQVMITNAGAILLSIAGTVLSIGVVI
jgi:4-hydroxybenzoate polyprenyltransferase